MADRERSRSPEPAAAPAPAASSEEAGGGDVPDGCERCVTLGVFPCSVDGPFTSEECEAMGFSPGDLTEVG